MKFHQVVEKIYKDGNNPAFKRGDKVSKYATLPRIQEAIAEPLQTVGLVYTQIPDIDNTLITILMHPESGEYFQANTNMNPVQNTPQATGSAITYSKRYALVAMLGLQIDDDDDGNAASGVPQAENKKAKSAELPWLNPGTDKWAKAVEYLKKPDGKIDEIKKKYAISKPNEAKLIAEAMN